jgi:hypothetical protein
MAQCGRFARCVNTAAIFSLLSLNGVCYIVPYREHR